MSIFRELEITDGFYGITANKGELIVNDGTKNIALPPGINGQVLTADSGQTTGLSWVTGSGGGSSVTSTQQILSAQISTNSTTPIEIADFTDTPIAGTHIVLVNFVFSISASSNSLTFGLYKNGILVSSTQRVVFGPGSNVKYSFGFQHSLTFSGTDILTYRISSSSVNSVITVISGDTVLLKVASVYQNTISTTFTTNSTTPLELTELTLAPAAGYYVIYTNLVYSLSKLYESVTISLYNDATLITPNSVLKPVSNNNEIYQGTHTNNFSGSNSLKVKVSVSNTNANVTIYSGNIILMLLS